MNKLVYGVGVNNAKYTTSQYKIIDGKRKRIWICPFYNRWKNMLERCYSEKLQNRHPSYLECVVCDEWLLFSNFRDWMETEIWENAVLDKDILVSGNKVYSPTTSVFIHHKVNSFILDCNKSRGDYMIGVSFYKPTGKFRASCRNPFNNRQENLGHFETEIEAHLAWKNRKHLLACELADSEYVTNERVAQSLRDKYKYII